MDLLKCIICVLFSQNQEILVFFHKIKRRAAYNQNTTKKYTDREYFCKIGAIPAEVSRSGIFRLILIRKTPIFTEREINCRVAILNKNR